jgi:hypothetical protein
MYENCIRTEVKTRLITIILIFYCNKELLKMKHHEKYIFLLLLY